MARRASEERVPEIAESAAPPRRREEPNVVFIGKKPLMTYVASALLQLTSASSTITLKARGRAISRAADVSQILLHRMAKDAYEVKEVRLGSETLTSSTGETRSVSTIEIVIGRKQ